MDLDQRQIALGLARARAINGIMFLVLPGFIGKRLFGEHGGSAISRAVLRMIGVRDLVLGVGAITTLKEHTMDAEWVGMGAIADAIDGAVMLLTPGLPLRSRFGAIAGGSAAVAGYQASRALSDERTERQALEASEIDS